MDAPIKTRRPWHSTHKKMRLQKLTNQIKRLNPDIASTEAQMHMKRHQGLQQNSHMRCSQELLKIIRALCMVFNWNIWPIPAKKQCQTLSSQTQREGLKSSTRSWTQKRHLAPQLWPSLCDIWIKKIAAPSFQYFPPFAPIFKSWRKLGPTMHFTAHSLICTTCKWFWVDVCVHTFN